jgi:hypothetical protein
VGKPLFTAEQFIAAIPGTGGIVTAIARKVGCTWHTAKKYVDEHPTVASAYQDECESILDLAEAKVISAIKGGDSQMIRYYLSTKGKRRGYSERHEITGAEGGPLEMVWDDGREVTPFASRPTDGLG